MTSSDNSFSHQPFKDLGRLLKRSGGRHLPEKKVLKKEKSVSSTVSDETKSDRQLFLEEVRDVTPIQNQNRSKASRPLRTGKRDSGEPQDAEPHRKLKRLIDSGEGFIISQTPEYMEGTGHHVPRSIAEQLHQGRFSIQDHIDLHGMDAAGATEAVERFLQRATAQGLRSVLIIHGRGLSSPGEPVLKTRLRELLASNRWRKWILAFSSARSCDGGAGATYVLIRKKPLSKKKRRQWNSLLQGQRM